MSPRGALAGARQCQGEAEAKRPSVFSLRARASLSRGAALAVLFCGIQDSAVRGPRAAPCTCSGSGALPECGEPPATWRLGAQRQVPASSSRPVPLPPHTTPQSPRLPAPPRPAAEDWLGLLAVASVWLFQLDVEGGGGAVSRDRETCTHVPGVVSIPRPRASACAHAHGCSVPACQVSAGARGGPCGWGGACRSLRTCVRNTRTLSPPRGALECCRHHCPRPLQHRSWAPALFGTSV